MGDGASHIHPVLPGAILGAGFGDVVLALNPSLLSPLPAARVVLGGIALGVLLTLPFAWLLSRRPDPGRVRPALLGVSLLLLAGLAEHQRTLSYAFLGNGARRVLVAVTTFAVIGAFLLAAVALRSRPARVPSGLLAALLALFCAVPAVGRRSPDRSPLAPPAEIPRTATRSLLVVGLDGVSWDLLSRTLSEGSLPVLGKLVKEGAAGPLGSLEPYDSAALWTSAATGKKPSKHGVVSGTVTETFLGEFRLLPRLQDLTMPIGFAAGRTRPLENLGRRSLTFWEILARRRHQAAVLNWAAARPAREGLVLWATEEMFAGSTASGAGLPVEAASAARLLHVQPDHLERPLARALQPAGLSERDLRVADPLAGAARDLSVVGATLTAVPEGPGSVSALRLAGLAGPARRFGPAAEPDRYWGRPPAAQEARAQALKAYYRFLDEALGELLERGGKDRTVCVFAPAGYGPPSALGAVLAFLSGQEPSASPANAPNGFLVLWGSGIRSGVRLTSAGVLDLAPTLLVLAGEPVARDMDGRVLAEVFDERFVQTASIPVVTTFEPDGPQ